MIIEVELKRRQSGRLLEIVGSANFGVRSTYFWTPLCQFLNVTSWNYKRAKFYFEVEAFPRKTILSEIKLCNKLVAVPVRVEKSQIFDSSKDSSLSSLARAVTAKKANALAVCKQQMSILRRLEHVYKLPPSRIIPPKMFTAANRECADDIENLAKNLNSSITNCKDLETFGNILRHLETFGDILRHLETFWDILGHSSETKWAFLGHSWIFIDINEYFILELLGDIQRHLVT